MPVGRRDRPRPSACAHRFRFVFDSRFLLGRVVAARKWLAVGPGGGRPWRVRGWGSKKRNPFSAHQSLTLRESPAGQLKGSRPSPPQAQLRDDGTIALDVLPLKIVQQPAALADQL